MSQAKVDRYKQEKANRKQTMKKEKRMRVVRSTVAGIIFIALIGWIGYSGYRAYEGKRPVQKTEVDYTSITDYIAGLSAQK